MCVCLCVSFYSEVIEDSHCKKEYKEIPYTLHLVSLYGNIVHYYSAISQ